MVKSVLELAVGTGQWDAGLKKAKSALDNFTQSQGGLQQALDKESQKMQKFVQMMGGMESTAKTAKGQMNDYKSTIEQLTMQYNRMSDAQKKAIGQDYLQSIDQLKQKYKAVNDEIQEMNRSLVQVNETAKDGGGFSDAMGGLTGKFFKGNVYAMIAEKGVEAMQSLGQHILDVTKRSYELAAASEGIVLAFNRLNRPELLDKLREATHGTVSDLELMKQAVKFNDFNLNLDEMGTLLAFAQQKAKDTGQSVDYMVDSIVTGLGRQSLMILDNLGLSASEVRERMKETGDMTTAVAAIIRDRMTEAGGYVETASDRMARSTVEVENAMLQLGTTMQETFDGASVDELSNKLEIKLLNELEDTVEILGMVKETFSGLGLTGDDAMTAIADATANTYHQMMLLLNPTMELLRLYKEFTEDDKVTIDRTPGGHIIEKPVKPTSPTTPKGKGSGRAGTAATVYEAGSIAAQEQEVQKLRKLWREAGDEGIKNGYLAQLIEAENVLKRMNEQATLQRERAEGRLLDMPAGDIGMLDVKGLGVGGVDVFEDMKNGAIELRTPLQALEEDLKELTKLQQQFGGISAETWQSYQAKIDAVQNKINTFQGKTKKGAESSKESWRQAAQAVTTVGGALQQIDDPAAKILGIVGQAIANIALGFAQATSKEASGGVWAWIAATAAGMATMITTISQIHAATGYAQGGIVKGNSYSGDNVLGQVGGYGGELVGLNAGEVVLTKAMQGNLASQLQGGGLNNMHLSASVKGEQLILSINNTGKRTGMGELVFWR